MTKRRSKRPMPPSLPPTEVDPKWIMPDLPGERKSRETIEVQIEWLEPPKSTRRPPPKRASKRPPRR